MDECKHESQWPLEDKENPRWCTRCGSLETPHGWSKVPLVGILRSRWEEDRKQYIELCRALGMIDEDQGRIASVATVEQAVAKIKQLKRDAAALEEVEEELEGLKDVINKSLPHYCNSNDPDDECNEAEKVEQAGDDLERNNVSGWKRKDMDTAFALPFGTIRQCSGCGCLVAGGPTMCRRCVKATGMR